MKHTHCVQRWSLPLALLTLSAAAFTAHAQQTSLLLPAHQQPQKQVKPLPSARKGSALVQNRAEEPTAELLVFLTPGTDRQAFERDYALTWVYTLQSDADAYLFRAADANAAQAALRRIAPTEFQSMMPERNAKATSDARIRAVYLNRRTQNVKTAFVPNDPLFPQNTPSGTTANWGQWHLVNPYTPGLDAGVQGAWNRDITGQGVLIGIVDDGVETAHPDLAPNCDLLNGYDFSRSYPNGNPVRDTDIHGTAAAGVAAARGSNGVGGTGAAPYARVAGLRIDFPYQTDGQFIGATLYHSSGSNTVIKIKSHSYSVDTPYADRAAQSDAFTLSASSGTIHVQSAGNVRADCSTRATLANPAVIPVSAMASNGKISSYSNYGACIFVTAPSSGGSPLFGITTTDLTGSLGYNGFPAGYEAYTPNYGGTSAAAALTAGVLALGKQVQPNLDGRFAKHLLARTSVVIDSGDTTSESDRGWITNAAGLKFNQNYGFGLINADALTRLAYEYSGVTPLEQEQIPTTQVARSIPDYNSSGIVQNFTLHSTTPLEELLVNVNITHGFRGDIEMYLISPRGTLSRLLNRSGDHGNNINWTFRSNAFWGESPQGQWQLMIRDVAQGDAGVWNSFSVTALMGKLTGKAYYVDKAHVGAEAGTQTNPYRTVTAALNAIPAGEFARIFIKAGNYGTDRPRTTKWVQYVNWTNTGQAAIGKS